MGSEDHDTSRIVSLCASHLTLLTRGNRYLPVAIGHHIFPRSIVCTTTALRLSNALLLFLLPFIIFRILSHFRSLPYPPRTEAGAKLKVRFLIPDEGVMIEAIVISCFPIAYFSGFMFYTDLASLCSVLLCYDCGLRGHHVLAGLVRSRLFHFSGRLTTRP